MPINANSGAAVNKQKQTEMDCQTRVNKMFGIPAKKQI